MIGRAAYENPILLSDVDPVLYDEDGPSVSRASVVEAVLPYLEGHLAAGGRVANVTRHVLHLFRGVPGGRAWRRTLAEGAHLAGAGPELLEAALRAVPQEVAFAPLGPATRAEPAEGAPPASRHGIESGPGHASRHEIESGPETAEVLAGDDQVLDLVGAFADAR